jgi:hypothetical protein
MHALRPYYEQKVPLPLADLLCIVSQWQGRIALEASVVVGAAVETLVEGSKTFKDIEDAEAWIQSLGEHGGLN